MIKTDKIDYYIHDLLNSKNVSEIWSQYSKILSKFKFDRIIYVTTNLSTVDLSESLKDGLVLSNHSPKFIQEMIKDKCFENDIGWFDLKQNNIMAWKTALCSQKINFSNYLFFPPVCKSKSNCEKRVAELCIKNSVTAGYTLYFKPEFGNRLSGFSLCSSPKMNQEETNQHWEIYGNSITMLSKLFDIKLRQLPYVHFSLLPIRTRLSKRQRETLYWISKGKSISETSIILDLSVTTIDKHLRLARKNLGTKTTIEAIVKAQNNEQLSSYVY